jgi:hypothetical protein
VFFGAEDDDDTGNELLKVAQRMSYVLGMLMGT